MSYEEILRELASLPPEDREQVADFIDTLRRRHSPSISAARPVTMPTTEPFVGMWSDREEMLDSSAWVRRSRQLEWVK